MRSFCKKSGFAVRICGKTTVARVAAAALVWAGVMLTAGCQRLIDGPKLNEADQVRPDKIVSFDTLYGENCAGCHGANGKNGSAIPMNNPEYMAFATDAQIRQITANGQTGTLMPAFAQSAGGLLTDQQINIIVSGMRERWGTPVAGFNPPPYAAAGAGDATKGAAVYGAACASCHGAADSSGAVAKPGKNGSIVDPTFLALLSDQSLRTIVIAGRPDLGQPDFRNDIPGHPLTDQEITDVVAWLSSHRIQPASAETHPEPAAKNPDANDMQRRVQ